MEITLFVLAISLLIASITTDTRVATLLGRRFRKVWKFLKRQVVNLLYALGTATIIQIICLGLWAAALRSNNDTGVIRYMIGVVISSAAALSILHFIREVIRGSTRLLLPIAPDIPVVEIGALLRGVVYMLGTAYANIMGIVLFLTFCHFYLPWMLSGGVMLFIFILVTFAGMRKMERLHPAPAWMLLRGITFILAWIIGPVVIFRAIWPAGAEATANAGNVSIRKLGDKINRESYGMYITTRPTSLAECQDNASCITESSKDLRASALKESSKDIGACQVLFDAVRGVNGRKYLSPSVGLVPRWVIHLPFNQDNLSKGADETQTYMVSQADTREISSNEQVTLAVAACREAQRQDVRKEKESQRAVAVERNPHVAPRPCRYQTESTSINLYCPVLPGELITVGLLDGIDQATFVDGEGRSACGKPPFKLTHQTLIDLSNEVHHSDFGWCKNATQLRLERSDNLPANGARHVVIYFHHAQ